MKKLGKISNVKFSNSKEMKGLVIEFETHEKINPETIVEIEYEDKTKYAFIIKEVEICNTIITKDVFGEPDIFDLKSLRGRAVEIGYWARKLGRKDIDIRTLLNLEIVVVEDEERKEEILEKSRYC